MMKPEEPSEIVEFVLNASRADETEVRAAIGKSALTRFANSAIHQNLVKNERSVLVRARVGNRLGESIGNCTGERDLTRLVETATEIARHSAPDDELLPLPGPQTYEPVRAFYADTDAAGPGLRADAVREIVRVCKSESLTAAGAFNTLSETAAVGNSRGLRACHSYAAALLSVTATGVDSSGWASALSRNVQDIDPEALARTAVNKAKLAANPQPAPTEPLPVILEPAAVAQLLADTVWGFNARIVDEGDSFLSRDDVGAKLAGERVTILCDPFHPALQGCPFDREGMPNRRVPLIENGVVGGLVYDRLTATKHGAQPSGYSWGGANREGAYPGCIVMGGGDTSLEEMIASSPKAILVTRIWYTSVVDVKRLIVTGMTRDGTFLIEDGKIVAGLRNLRLNVPILDALKTVDALGPQVVCQCCLMHEPYVIPPIRLNEFRFTSGTDF